MKLIFLTLVFGLATLSAFAEEKEILLGVTYDLKAITFQVKSTGCTTKKNFEVLISKSEPAKIELVRRVVDNCEAVVPNGAKVEFTYKELGLSQGKNVYLSNPIKPETIRVW